MNRDQLTTVFYGKREGFMQEKDEKYFLWTFKGVRILLRGSDIWYVSAEDGRTLIHTRNRFYQARETMKEEVEKLRELPMVKIHSSFLVNMDKLESISAKGAHLKNHIVLPVSKGCWTTARRVVEDYCRNKCSARKNCG